MSAAKIQQMSGKGPKIGKNRRKFGEKSSKNRLKTGKNPSDRMQPNYTLARLKLARESNKLAQKSSRKIQFGSL